MRWVSTISGSGVDLTLLTISELILEGAGPVILKTFPGISQSVAKCRKAVAKCRKVSQSCRKVSHTVAG